MRILIINGPNLNLLGIREPSIYGTESFDHFFEQLRADFEGIQLTAMQSNHEGAIIDLLHQAMQTADAVVINPGAYSHTSIAIADAIRSIQIPVIEVHISNIHAREAYRAQSYTAAAAAGVICGLGLEGYRQAVSFLLRKNQQLKKN